MQHPASIQRYACPPDSNFKRLSEGETERRSMASFGATQLGHGSPLPSPAPRNPRSTLFLCCRSPESSLISLSCSTPAPSATAGCARNGRPRCLSAMAAQNLAGSFSGDERLHLGVNIMERVDASQTACDQQTSPSTASQQTCKKIKWNSEMSKFLLSFLVDQAAAGMKEGMSFKRNALVAAAKAVSQKFKIKCDETDVEKRLKTLKTRWNKIQRLKCLSGASWDPVARMISLGTSAYQDHVLAHPRDAWLLNNPIDNYDELAIICGDDQANGKFTEDGNPCIGSIDRETEEQHRKNMQGLVDIEQVAKASSNQVRGHCQQEPAISTASAAPNPSLESCRRATSSRTKKQEASETYHQTLRLHAPLFLQPQGKPNARLAASIWANITLSEDNEGRSYGDCGKHAGRGWWLKQLNPSFHCHSRLPDVVGGRSFNPSNVLPCLGTGMGDANLTDSRAHPAPVRRPPDPNSRSDSNLT